MAADFIPPIRLQISVWLASFATVQRIFWTLLLQAHILLYMSLGGHLSPPLSPPLPRSDNNYNIIVHSSDFNQQLLPHFS
ncbi:hypothetical protein J3Q64DRAFT_1831713 [Phycomyces blakesleeanus]|uniref:Uncharacterized protein n=2 Tax=Phycomyces blakesleeanus TaxID=4837 RepID=A0A163DBM7_PHYB8|nr:hypothetical protein PHYBLDRAFT_148767 [Phycomyces blakesleeanus NRRL 1555(-)]OAD70220.1 hypothetical protein PHYBLDRAFT_148767 [Phycomyces blakesleeanus NRRL 1555(-)]|eukprot:XP_018288260.1 hypothetical protein PHYBLDRAFT_148767 [Phycomyces blakesleeanus NRRL 1555(-)]